MIIKMTTMETQIRMIIQETPTKTLITTVIRTVLTRFPTIPMNGKIRMEMMLGIMQTNFQMIDVPLMIWTVMENQILSRKIATLH